MTSIPERVARGVALLDERLPGWHERIDLDRLNLESPCNCVLGQQFVDDVEVPVDAYIVGLGELGIRDRAAATATTAELGFDISRTEELGDDEGASVYRALTAEWRRVILARRTAAPVSARRIRLDGHGLPPKHYPLPNDWDAMTEERRQALLDAACADGLTATIETDVDRITTAIHDRDGITLTAPERAVLTEAVTDIKGGAR